MDDSIYVVICADCNLVLRAFESEHRAELWASEQQVRSELQDPRAHGHISLNVEVCLFDPEI